MPQSRHYAHAQKFRQALDERLKSMARAANTSVNDLHKQLVFDRFLARLDPEQFVLTGGYSLELRLPNSRSTTDIDSVCLLKYGVQLWNCGFVLRVSNSSDRQGEKNGIGIILGRILAQVVKSGAVLKLARFRQGNFINQSTHQLIQSMLLLDHCSVG
jgi:hypothetical protein